ncbi:hypothetical protein SAMN04489727_4048 [Amycolatopsis tolypomycina]|uniref:Uncharacterized protein n=1 Tax=Amycolatopsis tolypomycina TaxID=208445 RepID=A0A1H4T711_9PSEU|nr:hypothetical protein [Amycolatopsis tolypomycina]SEC51944.1 hypothetical protein SAMN04489727_4048 [Amycolatopsis tolypomycina]
MIGLLGGLLIFGNRDGIAATMRETNRQRGGTLTEARIVLTVLTGLQLLSVLIGQSTIGGYVAVLAAVVGVALSFTGPSNAYFAAAKSQV